MLLSGDLALIYWIPFFYPIVDLGACTLLYYINLEKELNCRQKMDLITVSGRHIYIIYHKDQIDPDVLAQRVARGK